VYSVAHWFERQDALKKILRDKPIPQFYNMMIERSEYEPNRPSEMVFIDPINYGNQASCFSHSCKPNCIALSQISEGKYYIVIQALT
jgi:hypothetical protein